MASTTFHLLPASHRPAHLTTDAAFVEEVCVDLLAGPQGAPTGVEVRTSPSEVPYVFKLGRGSLLKRVSRGLFAAPTRSRRAFEIGTQLHHAEVATPLPLAFAEQRLGPLALRDALVMEFIEAPTLAHRFILDPDPEAWVRRAAASIRAMHDAGVRHRDLKSSNLLARERPGHSPDVVILDLDGARPCGGPPPFDTRVRDLARLAVSLDVQGCSARIERAYADLDTWSEDEVRRASVAIADFIRFKRARAERQGRDLT